MFSQKIGKWTTPTIKDRRVRKLLSKGSKHIEDKIISKNEAKDFANNKKKAIINDNYQKKNDAFIERMHSLHLSNKRKTQKKQKN